MADEQRPKFVRKYKSHAEMKADAYRYWQSRPVEERMDAVSELTTAAYALKALMYKDFRELLSAFHAHGVRYLIVGGYAVSFYAEPRTTKDLDIFIKADPTNARAVFRALASFGAPLEGFTIEDFADPDQFIRFGREPVAFDILPGIAGVDFEAAWVQRVEGVMDRLTGFRANFISREDLIASKLAAGRLQDLADVEAIRQAAAASADSSSE